MRLTLPAGLMRRSARAAMSAMTALPCASTVIAATKPMRATFDGPSATGPGPGATNTCITLLRNTPTRLPPAM
jgi:hypothetical protein